MIPALPTRRGILAGQHRWFDAAGPQLVQIGRGSPAPSAFRSPCTIVRYCLTIVRHCLTRPGYDPVLPRQGPRTIFRDRRWTPAQRAEYETDGQYLAGTR